MSDLGSTIKDYESAIERLSERLSKNGVKGLAGDVLRALIVRDQIARFVTAEPIADADVVAALAEQDERLKKAARRITRRIGRTEIQNWREAAGRGDDAWWWLLDRRADAEKSWKDLLSTTAAWVLIALSLSFSLEIVRRYLNGGADFTSTVLQGVIALIAGGTIFKSARQFAEGGSKPIAGYGILSTPKSRWVVAALLLAVTLVLVITRPMAAGWYSDAGAREYKQKRLTRAIEKYNHAISLDPTLAETHFNLGNAYEDVLQYDKAMNEYTEAILADQSFYRPYNNLARLYILHRNDYAGALKFIDKALALNINPADANPDNVQYAYYKNRGWANIGLKNYRQAQKDLAKALTKRRDGISAHCLLAQTLEATANKQGALDEWRLCSDMADRQKQEVTSRNQYDVDEPEIEWLETAKERLGGR